MINREDMLELTRRMTLARTSFTRIAGCYVDRDGDFDGSFNTNFRKLSAPEQTKQLKLAKEIPFSATNVNLKEYEYPAGARRQGSMWQLLMAMNECGLKNDALMDTFYDIVMERYRSNSDYAILVYMICAICPLAGEYEPGKPVCGFLFPAFADRSGDPSRIDVFQMDADRPHKELMEILGI